MKGYFYCLTHATIHTQQENGNKSEDISLLSWLRFLRKLAHWLKEKILCFCWKYCDRDAPEMFSISWEIVIQCNKSQWLLGAAITNNPKTMINYHKLVAFLLTVLEVRRLKSVPWGKKSGGVLWGCKAGRVCYLLQISTFPAFLSLLCLITLTSVLSKLPLSIMCSKIPLCFDLIRA